MVRERGWGVVLPVKGGPDAKSRLEPGPDLRPVVDNRCPGQRRAPAAVGSLHVPAAGTLVGHPQRGDRRGRPFVQLVALQPDASEAVVERVPQHQELALGVHRGAPH